MRGGLREGSGRKNVTETDKRKMRSIYLTDQECEAIMDLDMEGHDSISSRCRHLLLDSVARFSAVTTKHNNSCSLTAHPNSLRFIDLFAGIGGIRKGFEDENTVAVFSSEWDKYAQQTYAANYGEIPQGDITKIAVTDIPEHDVLLAGFPCQPFSSIGKREGFAHATQGTLFFDVLRIISHHQPKMFLLENVQGLLTIQKGETFRIIVAALKEAGYDVYHDVLDAQNFGLPQVRKRVVIVGFRNDLGVHDFVIPQGNPEEKVSIKTILEDDPRGYSISEHLQKTYLYKIDDGRPQIVDKTSDIQIKTLVASYHKIQRLTGTFVKGGETGVRLLSELECKRLMGFPDDFIVPVSRTQMYRQFGNSVAVPMMRAVADAMKVRLREAHLNNESSLIEAI
jgi:DNA (cytosine-5)-methyltransferase 1